MYQGYCQDTVTDIDGNVYMTIKIGNQVWMAENLRVTHYNDGSPIPYSSDKQAWGKKFEAGYCIYDSSYFRVGGALYNWFAVTNDKLAPKGWHVPSDEEWKILINYLGGEQIAGGKLKYTGTTQWQSPNTGATNECKFYALPGGFRTSNGNYAHIGYQGYWWTKNKDDDTFVFARYRKMSNDHTRVERSMGEVNNGFSVRCIKD